MTDNTVPNSLPEPMDDAASNGHETVSPERSPAGDAAAESDWEPVTFPGQISLDGGDESSAPTSDTSPAIESTVLPPSNSQESPANTEELVQLIQDLNHCNDALLNRISNLEEALERSQAALQSEVERNQGLVANGSAAMSQQVAQLLGELDIANDGLRRTTMHNEALQAELDVSQQRVAQLERECTLLQQRFNEKSVALQQAENTCRDLKSRLHRQQRYTLQFKAALEKCLNMPAQQQTGGTEAVGNYGLGSNSSSHPVAMPRSQHIQPWSANQNAPSQDVDLSELLRGIKAKSQFNQGRDPSAASRPAPLPLPTPAPSKQVETPTASPVEKTSDLEAEALLWQDLERVTESQSPAVEPLSQEFMDDPWRPSESELPQSEVAVPPAEPSVDTTADEVTFTEPSPWGAPLPGLTESAAPSPELRPEAGMSMEEEVLPTVVRPQPPVASPPAPVRPPEAQNDVSLPSPLQESIEGSGASPAPLVYPLRSQKRRKSLASVELPSFGRSRRR